MQKRRSIETHSDEETIQAGEKFSRELRPGTVVACYGELGSGKTRFIKGICRGFGVEEHVASPTFTIVNEYAAKGFRIFHFDFYRMKSTGELREIGFEEYLDSDGITLIEWADRVKEFLPANRYDVFLSLGGDEQTRRIEIEELSGVTA